MRDIIQPLFVILFVAVFSIFSQTSADLQRTFGRPLEAYEVRPNILMTVQYDNVGNISVVTFEGKHALNMTVSSENGYSSTSGLYTADIDALLKEVAPESVRGKRVNRMSVNSSCNGIYAEVFEYLSIHRAAGCEGLYSVQVRWKR